MTTEERLTRLEQELSGVRAELDAARQGNSVIYARSFVVVDDQGNKLASLGEVGIKTGHPGLALFDQNGDTRLALSLFDDEPALYMYGDDYEPRLALSFFSDGPELTLFNEGGVPSVDLYTSNDQQPTLHLKDSRNHTRVLLSVAEDGPKVALFDEGGNCRANLSVLNVVSVPKDGPIRDLKEESRSALRLSDKNGRLVWQTVTDSER